MGCLSKSVILEWISESFIDFTPPQHVWLEGKTGCNFLPDTPFCGGSQLQQHARPGSLRLKSWQPFYIAHLHIILSHGRRIIVFDVLNSFSINLFLFWYPVQKENKIVHRHDSLQTRQLTDTILKRVKQV